jgi:meso-butanediol dehydrogenase/(S,S)-butanediol dehydrogenase/diacetyl reductase
MGRLAGKVALVTGGARGLGLAVCERLAAEGAAVAVLALHSDTARAAAERLAAEGGRAIALSGDVANEADVVDAVAATVAQLGRLDVMVNNAGTIEISPLIEQTLDGWERVQAVNLRGVFLGCREAARQMIAQGEGGRILNCSSGAGRRGGALVGAYTASKFGVIGLTQSLAVELAAHGITVNAYCPGHVTVTPMWEFIDSELQRRDGLAPGEAGATAVSDAPLARSGRPEEIAALVAFLASDESSFITGESILIDGGLVRF